MRLDVRKIRSEKLLGPLAGDILDHVHTLAAAVIAVPRIPLRVFVGEHAARRSEHRLAHQILGRYELYIVPLSFQLRTDRLGYLFIRPRNDLYIFLYHAFRSSVSFVP